MIADGAWKVMTTLIPSPTGETGGTLVLKTESATLTGKVISPSGTFKITNGKVDGTHLTWTVKTRRAPFEFSATVEGDQISGCVNLGPLGETSFSGVRTSAALVATGSEHRAIAFSSGRARLVELDAREPGPGQIAGPTVATLISPGTELANAEFTQDSGHELRTGYAAVFRVTRTGEGATRFREGQLAFCTGPHASWQVIDEASAIPVPPGLAAEKAVFARMMGVSMTALRTAASRPPAPVLVTGLGLVGALAARNFAACGYRVTGYDPSPQRRASSAAAGIDVRDTLPEGPGPYELAVDCSGHEEAVLACCQAVVEGGEVILVGVPHKQHTDMAAHALMKAVFDRYVRLRGGWEWELPLRAERFRPASVFGNFQTALDWLADGRVTVDELAQRAVPSQATEVYERLGAQAGPPSYWFDWGSIA